MKNILLFFALFGFAVMISCSSQLARKTARPVEAPAVVFEKKSPDTLPPILKVSTDIVPPDTVYFTHTETIREVLDTAALNNWLEQNREMLTEVREMESKVIGKLILDYNASLDENEELIRKYFQVQEEKKEVAATVEKTQKVLADSPLILIVLVCTLSALIIIKQRYTRMRLEKEIRAIKTCRRE